MSYVRALLTYGRHTCMANCDMRVSLAVISLVARLLSWARKSHVQTTALPSMLGRQVETQHGQQYYDTVAQPVEPQQKLQKGPLVEL